MKASVIVADPAYGFKDKLKQSDVKRSADSQYNGTMTIDEIKAIDVPSIAADNCVLALWVPSALLKEGMDIMDTWGFDFKQTHVWVKTKKDPLKNIWKLLPPLSKLKKKTPKEVYDDFHHAINEFNVADVLSFYMGHYFRQPHEICLIRAKGKTSSMLKNKSQRSVHFGPVTDHSAKPEDLQDMLDKMYPDEKVKVELFARRERTGWVCMGNQCNSTYGQDINDSVEDFKNE